MHFSEFPIFPYTFSRYIKASQNICWNIFELGDKIGRIWKLSLFLINLLACTRTPAHWMLFVWTWSFVNRLNEMGQS